MILGSDLKAYDITVINTRRCGNNSGAGIRHRFEE